MPSTPTMRIPQAMEPTALSLVWSLRGWERRFICAMLLSMCSASLLSAQTTWEFSPYRVQAWIVVERSPFLPQRYEETLSQAVVAGAWSAAEYGWQLTADAAPITLRGEITQRLNQLPFEALRESTGKPPPCDKLFLISVREHKTEFEIAVREWDMPSRHGGETLHLRTYQLEAVPELVLKGIVETFRPLAKIEKVDGKNIVARVRAGGMITSDDSLLTLNAGAVLHPVIRRNQRNGEPLPNGITNPAWTYLDVKSRENALLQCALQTGLAGSVPSKGGARIERFALAVKRTYPETEISIMSRKDVVAGDTSKRAKVSRPLADYEVYSKEAGEESSTSLGLTDWQGKVRLKPDDKHVLRVLYVRNGSQFLARLPVVVGHLPELTMEVFDDDPRLLAETKLRAMQSRVMDVMARREILAARIRMLIKQENFEEANKLLAEFRALPQRVQITKELDEDQRRTPAVPGITGKRITALFNGGRQLLNKFLDPELANQLAREIAVAQKPAAPAKAPISGAKVSATN